mgnify:CR=1 FL=1
MQVFSRKRRAAYRGNNGPNPRNSYRRALQAADYAIRSYI